MYFIDNPAIKQNKLFIRAFQSLALRKNNRHMWFHLSGSKEMPLIIRSSKVGPFVEAVQLLPHIVIFRTTGTYKLTFYLNALIWRKQDRSQAHVKRRGDMVIKRKPRGIFRCIETWKLALKKKNKSAKTVKHHLVHPDLSTWMKKNNNNKGPFFAYSLL